MEYAVPSLAIGATRSRCHPLPLTPATIRENNRVIFGKSLAARGAKRNDLALTQQGANIICGFCNKELRVAKDQQKVLFQHQRHNKKCIEKALIQKAQFWKDEDRRESMQQQELWRVHEQEVQRKSSGRLCGEEVLQHLFGPVLSQSLKDTIPWGPWISYFVHRHECDPNPNQVNYKQDRLWNMMRTLVN